VTAVRAAAWAAATAGAAALVWWAWPVREATREPAPARAVDGAVPAVAPRVPPAEAVAPPELPDFAMLRIPARQPGEVEVCGEGAAAPDSPAQAQLLAQADARTRRVLQTHLQQMRDARDPQLRAAALMLQGDLAALRELTTRSADPVVHAYAHQACLRTALRSPGGCAGFSVQRWAEVDPDNAVPWLALGDEALARGDPAAADAAYARAAQAAQVQAHEHRLVAQLWDARSRTLSAHDSLALLKGLAPLQAQLVHRSRLPLIRHCRAVRAADDERRATCDDLAQLFAARAVTLQDYQYTARLAEAAGWPAPMVEQLRANAQALRRLAAPPVATTEFPGGALGCAALAQTARALLETSRHGAMPVLRERLRRTGLNEQALVERYRTARRPRPVAAASAPRPAASVPASPAR
jgi:hypothetical protein